MLSVHESVSIDGVPVQNLFGYRAPHAPFGYTVPAVDNMPQYFGAEDWPTTYVFAASSDGYLLMMNPLPPGIHTINFGGDRQKHWASRWTSSTKSCSAREELVSSFWGIHH